MDFGRNRAQKDGSNRRSIHSGVSREQYLAKVALQNAENQQKRSSKSTENSEKAWWLASVF